MRKPNFFIIGAPKCGTSTMLYWLRQHPQVLMPQSTEPHLFNTDHPKPQRFSLAEYERMFADAGEQHTVVGEKSVWYLASNDAVSNILEYSPEAKLLVCIRNPIEMAYALHHQQVYGGSEPILDFAKAWDAQDERARLTNVPATNSTHLLYGPMCRLGSHIERLFAHVSKERVHIVFLEDMKQGPSAAYAQVLDFLDLPPFTPNFRKVNVAKVPRSPFVGHVIRRLGRAKRALGIERSLGVLPRVEAWNRVPQQWRADPRMTELLRSYFEDDIALLGRLTARDLSYWLRSPELG